MMNPGSEPVTFITPRTVQYRVTDVHDDAIEVMDENYEIADLALDPEDEKVQQVRDEYITYFLFKFDNDQSSCY